ncbi:6832_t:CDS:1 [Ambispora leptoticha]|uniref:6832_t:CDS:1 n=1 Tax=Ambispora leptoticha TaxID=144679 RepID=A0A9N8ZXC0_9GLOM|nr:6832_t:CDS:1 [Ambispora leptoticha]
MRVKRPARQSTYDPILRIPSNNHTTTTQIPYLLTSQLIENSKNNKNNNHMTLTEINATNTSLFKSANTRFELSPEFLEELYSEIDPATLMRIHKQLTLSIKELITPKRKSRRGQTPRPQNSFVLYRRDMQARLTKDKGPKIGANLPFVSKIASKSWKKEPQEVRQVYEALAELAKKVHLEVHPDYVYKPKKRRDKRSTRFDFDVETNSNNSNDDSLSQLQPQQQDFSLLRDDSYNITQNYTYSQESNEFVHSSSNLPSFSTLTTLLRSPSPPHMTNYYSGGNNNGELVHELEKMAINDEPIYFNSPIQQQQKFDNYKRILCNEINCDEQLRNLKIILPQIESVKKIEISDPYGRGLCKLLGAP